MTGQTLTLAALLPVVAAVAAWLVLWDTRRAVRTRAAHARTLLRAAVQAHLDMLLHGDAYVRPAPSLWDDQWRRDLAVPRMEEAVTLALWGASQRAAVLVVRPEAFVAVRPGDVS